MKAILLSLIVTAVVAPGGMPTQLSDNPAEIELELLPAEVRAGMFYDGATVQVHAVVPTGAAVAVVCIGERTSVSFSKKGKVFGLIWMNVGEVSFEDIPNLYLVNTSVPMEGLGPPESLAELGVGYASLEGNQGFGSAESESGTLLQELIRLKESEELYGISEGAVVASVSPGGGSVVDTEFRLPAKAPEGDYRILLFGFTPEGGRLLGESRVRVQQVGLASFISSLGREHGLLYGILAVVIAIGVGLMTGVAFGIGSKGGH